jgi:N utilization substance protein B
MNMQESSPDKPTSFNGRKKARRYAVQALYGWSMTQNDLAEIEDFILSEHQDEIFDKEYFSDLICNITQNVQEIDTIMEPLLSRKLEELDFVELAVLRIAVYELKNRPEIPYRVVINEALNLTKTFGATDGYKFVNGVLDKLAKILRSVEIR